MAHQRVTDEERHGGDVMSDKESDELRRLSARTRTYVAAMVLSFCLHGAFLVNALRSEGSLERGSSGESSSSSRSPGSSSPECGRAASPGVTGVCVGASPEMTVDRRSVRLGPGTGTCHS